MLSVKPPQIPKKLTETTLTANLFHSDDEVSGLAFAGGQLHIQDVEHLGLRQVRFEDVLLDNSVLYSPTLVDVRLERCSLTNATCERLIARRVEFIGCRLLGLNVTDGHFQNVTFRDCDVQLTRFRFSSFDSVIFNECNLTDANFQGADLSGVRFEKCNLGNAEMSQAKLTGTDFRTSTIEGLRVGPKEVIGAVVDHFQAAYMASLLGLIIKDDNEG